MLTSLLTLLLAGTAQADVVGYDTCASAGDVEDALVEAGLLEAVETFSVIRLDPDAVEEAIASGEALLLPGVGEDGDEIEISVSASDLDFGDGGAAHTKDPDLGDAAAEAGASQEAVLGCDSTTGGCGAITFFDSEAGEPGLYEGAVMGDGTGHQVYESFETLYANLTGTPLDELEVLEPGCGVVYNAVHHADISEVFEEERDQPGEEATPIDDHADPFINATINIILDADATYYTSGRSTVWSRQKALLNPTRITFALLEPLLGSNWSINLRLESQEAWTSGGPTQTGSSALDQEINGSSYHMINHPTYDEVSYFYVGYDMDGGAAGEAGGICGHYDTWGYNVSNPLNHAWGQQVKDSSGYAFNTFHGRMVVMVHELGHMFGGLHSEAERNATRSGLLTARGHTVMGSGAANGVAPDQSGTMFSDDNSDLVYTCLDRVF